MRGEINSAQVGQQDRGGALSDRDVEVAIVRVLQNKLGLKTQTIQRMQELTGERMAPGEKGRPRAAVRRQDVAPIGRMKPMKSTAITAAPTAADFNALRADVKQIFEALESMLNALESAFDA